MEKLSSLQYVNASALPARVLVLMSKYAKALKQYNGTIIKLSSLRAFNQIHLSCTEAQDKQLNRIYQQLLEQVNSHINAGLMVTNQKIKQTVGKNSKHRLSNNLPERTVAVV